MIAFWPKLAIVLLASSRFDINDKKNYWAYYEGTYVWCVENEHCWSKEMREVIEPIMGTIIILSLMSSILRSGKTIANFGQNAIIWLIDEEDLKRKDNKST